MLAEQTNKQATKQTQTLSKILIAAPQFYFGFCLQHLMITILVAQLEEPGCRL